jgi:hypothetical protein
MSPKTIFHFFKCLMPVGNILSSLKFDPFHGIKGVLDPKELNPYVSGCHL